MGHMQYKNYEIQCTDSSYIIRDSCGNYIVSTESDTEAIQYIDDLLNNNKITAKPNKIDWYDRFCNYCIKLPYKCYIKGQLATTNEKVLNKLITSFEKSNKVKIYYYSKVIDGERFYIVDKVINTI